MSVSLIVAMDEGRLIGRAGGLPWHIPEEMQAFKRITTGHPCVMGRKTWESLKKPLPGRLNVIVTRQPDYRAEGALVTSSLVRALAACATRREEWGDEVFVIGGAELYRLALPLADRLYLTKVQGRFAGDTYFPEFDAAAFQATRTGGGEGPPPYEMWLLERS
jgi:dihydrofolate reductase